MTSTLPVLRFADVGLGDVPSVGGKGASLGELLRAGIRVPNGFVVTTAAFRQAIEHLDAEGDIVRRIAALDPADAASLAGTTAEIRAIVAREYGMPAVVGTGTATARIKTGDRLRVDGDRGIVTILG